MDLKNNTGKDNSGNSNSGHSNSGYSNSGNYNSGHYNSGVYNSGHYNSGNYNSGHFNTNSPKARLFNIDTDIKLKDINIPYIELKVTEWIPEESMTETQKFADKDFFIKKGTLIKRTYEEAWALAWPLLSKEVQKQFTDLPNFNAEIFLEITGIDLAVKKEVATCNGKLVEIDGKKYKLTEV